MRDLRRRVEALRVPSDPEAVFAAIDALQATGIAPPGPHGDRARELWASFESEECEDIAFRASLCRWVASGLSFIDYAHG